MGMYTPRQIAHGRCVCSATNGEDGPHHSDACNSWMAVVEIARADGLVALASEIVESPRRLAIIERARARLGVSNETLLRKMEFMMVQDTPQPEKI